jgi:diguanylate cyclase (GGDEF)-like protein/PAS domain S-box-containing protein
MTTPLKTHRLDSQALGEELFNSVPDGIVVVDAVGCISEANPQMEKLFGYACSELLGQPVEILVPERFRSGHMGLRRDYTDKPQVRAMGGGLDLYGRRKDGSEFPVEIMLVPVEVAGERLVLGLIRDISERKHLEQGMARLALSDPLTGLGNYRQLHEAFVTTAKLSQRSGRPCALLVLDLDGLKKINDAYGHAAGSRALCRVADALRAECRAIDTAARHGGDEFSVIMPDTDAEGARNVAGRLASRVEKDGENPSVAFSYGLGVYPRDGQTLDQLLAIADRALYAMKRSKKPSE